MTSLSRREFLTTSGSCAAHLALAAAVLPRSLHAMWTAPHAGPVVATEPFGRLERVAENIWALVSTPLGGDYTTVCNGGIIAGTHAVLAIEGFQTPKGSQWLAGQARALTGRWPTHVLLTHYHSDHANGVAGYLANGQHPAIHATSVTRDEVLSRNKPADADRTAALRDVVLVDATRTSEMDLGGRRLSLVPQSGHTDSDVAVVLNEPNVVFCGDLFWNAMFPNYVDAMPSKLAASVRVLRARKARTYIPGHGAIGAPADFSRYAAMIDSVGEAATKAHAAGLSASDAAAHYNFPAPVGDWVMFNKMFVERAFVAWYRELDGGTGE